METFFQVKKNLGEKRFPQVLFTFNGEDQFSYSNFELNTFFIETLILQSQQRLLKPRHCISKKVP